MSVKLLEGEQLITTITFNHAIKRDPVFIAQKICPRCAEALQESSNDNGNEALSKVRRDLRLHIAIFHQPPSIDVQLREMQKIAENVKLRRKLGPSYNQWEKLTESQRETLVELHEGADGPPLLHSRERSKGVPAHRRTTKSFRMAAIKHTNETT